VERRTLNHLVGRSGGALVAVELLPDGLGLQVQVTEESRDDPAFHHRRNEWDGDDKVAVNLS
jgi:hypothetical protein